MKYDIFISYRREGGYDTAKHLNDLLVRDGYKVSFDIDTLRSGNFDTQLYERIDQCTDFVLIVDQHAFDRTLDPNFKPEKDWLRCELAYALKKNKNIIPIFLSGVEGFPDGLPEDIIEVTLKNGPEYHRYYFNDFYNTLKKRFLHPKKNHQKLIFIIPIILAFIITLFLFSNSEKTTEEKKNDKELISSVVKDGEKTIDDTYGVPPAPKYTEAKIRVEDEPKDDSSAQIADTPFIGYIITSEEIDDNTIMATIQNAETRVREVFYIYTGDMCNADISWLPYILVEGNKVKIEYYSAGSRGLKSVLTMENLPREN